LQAYLNLKGVILINSLSNVLKAKEIIKRKLS
jgi:hypothetical protein